MSSVFHFEELDGQIGLLTFDLPDKKVNTLSEPVLEELGEYVGQLEERTDLCGLLFRSGKPGQFIAGADLNELGALIDATSEQIAQTLAAGRELFTRISQLPFPTVALVDGNSMGGGTELILAMDYRIASDNPATKIALPEVKIGIIPAWGGTQRLPRLIGIHYAIEMICGGEPISSQKAGSWGLVFDVVPVERLVEEGCRLIEHVRKADEWTQDRRRRQQPLGLTDDQLTFTFSVAKRQIHGKTKGQYPAPLAALRSMKDGINRPLDEALQIEHEIAHEVVGSPISCNLIGVFFMNNQLSRDSGVDNLSIQPEQVNHVGVLGSGQMGSGIATACVRRGIPCLMVDVDNDRIADGLERARHVVDSRIKIGRATPKDMQNMLSLLNTSISQASFSDCDVVVEAITENESLKTEAYRQLAESVRHDVILASNTSTISITRMSASAPNPERFIGMHFFHPVDRMQLVEVIRSATTSDETVATIVSLAKRIGKTPIVMQDCAGFLVNRVLLPYMSESLLLLLEGASMDTIDNAAVRFGMPMGPIALHDLIGLDTACYAGKVVAAAYSDRAVEVPLLEQLVEAGRLGKKSGAGFRKFVGKRKKPVADPDFEPFLQKKRSDDRQFTDEEITERLFLPMLLEATRCLDERIVREPAHVDMGLLLGIGFPTFRGGILRWCDTEGAGTIIGKLAPYSSLGKRFEPTDSLKQLAHSGKRFYPQ